MQAIGPQPHHQHAQQIALGWRVAAAAGGGALPVPAGLVFSAVFYLWVLFTYNGSFGGTPPMAAVAATA